MADGARTEGRPAPPPKPTARPPGIRPKIAPRVLAKLQPPIPQRPTVASRTAKPVAANGLPSSNGDPPTSKVPPPLPSVPPCAHRHDVIRNVTPPPRASTPTEKSDNDSGSSSRNSSPIPEPRKPSMAGMVRVLPLDLILAKSKAIVPGDNSDDSGSDKGSTPSVSDVKETVQSSTEDPGVDPASGDGVKSTEPEPEFHVDKNDVSVGQDSASDSVEKVESTSARASPVETQTIDPSNGSEIKPLQMVDTRRSESPVPPNTVLISGIKPEDLRKGSKKPVKPKPLAKPSIKPKPFRGSSQFYVGLADNENKKQNSTEKSFDESNSKCKGKYQSKFHQSLESEVVPKLPVSDELAVSDSVETQSQSHQGITDQEDKEKAPSDEIEAKEPEKSQQTEDINEEELESKIPDVVSSSTDISVPEDAHVSDQNITVETETSKAVENLSKELEDVPQVADDSPRKPPRRKKTLKAKSQDSFNKSLEVQSSQENVENSGKSKSSFQKPLQKQENFDNEEESRKREERLKRVPSRKAPPPPGPNKIIAQNIEFESQKSDLKRTEKLDIQSDPPVSISTDPRGSQIVEKDTEKSKAEGSSESVNVQSTDQSANPGSIRDLAASMGQSISKGLQHQLTGKTRPKPGVKPKPKPPLLKPKPRPKSLDKSREDAATVPDKSTPVVEVDVEKKLKDDKKYGRNSSYSKALDDLGEELNVEVSTEKRKSTDHNSQALENEKEEVKKPILPGMIRVLPIDLKESKVNLRKEDSTDDSTSQGTPEVSPTDDVTPTVTSEDHEVGDLSEGVKNPLDNKKPVFVPPPPPETETESKMHQFPSVEDEQNERLSQQIPIALLDDQVFQEGKEPSDEGSEDDDYEEVEFRGEDFDDNNDTQNIYEPPPDLPPRASAQKAVELQSDEPPMRPPKRKGRPLRSAPPVPIQSPPASPMTSQNNQNFGSPPLPPRVFNTKSVTPKTDSVDDTPLSRSPSDMYDAEGYMEPIRHTSRDEVYSYADVPGYPSEKKSTEQPVLRPRPQIPTPTKAAERESTQSITSIRTSGGSHIYEHVVSRPGSVCAEGERKEAPSEHRISGKSIFYFGVAEDDLKSDVKSEKDEYKESEPKTPERPVEQVTLDTPIPVPTAPPRSKKRNKRVPPLPPAEVAKKIDSDVGDSSDSDYIYPDDPDFVKPEDSIYLKDGEQNDSVIDGKETANEPAQEEEGFYHEADEPTSTDEAIYHEADEADDSALDSTSGTTSSVASPDQSPPPIPPRDHHKSEPAPQAIRRALELQRSTSTVSDSRVMVSHLTPKSVPKTVSFESHMADSGLSLSPSGDEYMKSPDSEEAAISPRPALRSISISSPNIGLGKPDGGYPGESKSGRPYSWASSGDGYEDPKRLRSGSLRKSLGEDQESVISESHTSGMDTTHGSGSSINSDPSDNSDDEEVMKEKADKRKRKQSYIAREIMTSEESFVDVLRLINIDFRLAVNSATASHDHPVVPTTVMNQILQYLPQLQNFNEELLKDLKQRIDNWSSNPRVSDIFVRKGPFLKMYTFYIREFENSMIALDEARKKYPEFDAAVRDFEASPRCKHLFIKHFMLKPIQRIPQYKLLLQDYLKYLKEDHPDYKDTKTALAIVSEVADQANESMKYGDNFKKLWVIQSALIGQFEVIKPGREFLKEGMLHKLSRKVMQPRMFFLFSDVMLYTTPVSAGYKLNNDIPLTGMRVSKPTKEDFQNEFSILSTQRSFTISASTPEEREEWLTTLQDAIRENAKRRSSFDVRKLHKMPSVLVEVDLDFMLGQRAPVWVPDARVSMCMLCTAEFSVTFRRHHCRACGKVVCGFCSDYRAPLRYLMYKAARVCIECYHKLSKDFDEGDGVSDLSSSFDADRDGSFSKASIKSKFRGISWGSYRKASKAKRPAVLQEVAANDEAAEMSGYLKVWRNKKWKKLWFVLKGKIFYTYKASEDTAAIESMVLLGYEVRTFNSWFEGVEPSLVFEISHKGTSPMVFRTESSSSRDKWLQAMRDATIP